MNEAEDKKLVEEINQLNQKMNQLEEEIDEKKEEWGEEGDRLNKISKQSVETLNKHIAEFNEERDLEKRAEIWDKHGEATKGLLEVEKNYFDAAIKHFETVRDDYENLFEKNKEKVRKLYKRLKQFDGVEKEKKKAELREGRVKGARLKKLENYYQKTFASAEDTKKQLKKIGVEWMVAVERIVENWKWVAKKEKARKGEKDAKKKQRLQDEINKNDAEMGKLYKEFTQKFDERSEISEKAKRKSDSLQRAGDILSRARDDDELYINLFIELQEMSEVTEQTAEIQKRTEKIQERTEKIQERIEKSQNETAEIQKGMLNQLEHLKKNTSEDQQYKTAAFTVILTILSAALIERLSKEWPSSLGTFFLLVLFAVLLFWRFFPYLKRFYREIWSK